MDIEEANRILKDKIRRKDNSLYCVNPYLSWSPDDDVAIIDGEFTADELEAIACWMQNNGKLK